MTTRRRIENRTFRSASISPPSLACISAQFDWNNRVHYLKPKIFAYSTVTDSPYTVGQSRLIGQKVRQSAESENVGDILSISSNVIQATPQSLAIYIEIH